MNKNIREKFIDNIKKLKTIITDFKGLKWYEYLFLITTFIFITLFGILDFKKLFSGQGFHTTWEEKDAVWKQVLTGLSGIIGFTGICTVFMVGKGKLSNYMWGTINTSIYGVFAFSVGYTGDAMLNILFFLPIQFIGFFTWKQHIVDTVVEVKKFRLIRDSIIYFILAAILFVIFWFLIPVVDKFLNHNILQIKDYGGYNFQHKYIPRVFDVLTNTLSIVAQILMLKRYKEQWYLWIFINILQITMYAGINGWGINIPMILMWGIFLINAIYSLINWIKLEKRKKYKKITN